ncbi:MAG: ABC transporter substrate-binding protein [Clostridiaceae bacterium]
MKKGLISAVLATGMMLTLASCSTPQTPGTAAGTQNTTSAAGTTAPATDSEKPKLSGTMKVVATSEDYVKLFEDFTKETGVKVELLSMSSGEVLSKLRAEGGSPTADLWFGGGIDAFMSAKEDNLLEKVTFDATKDISPDFLDKDGYWFSKGITIVGFLVNDKLLNEMKLEAPKTWKDLLDEKYKDEVIMSNPAVSGTNYAVVNAVLQTLGEEEGWKYFEGLNNNIAYYGKRGSDPLNKTISDEFAVGISYIDRGVEALTKEHEVSIVYPTDGIPWVPEGVAVFKNSDNVEAAKYFVEWLFSNDDNLRKLAEIDKKDGIKIIKPSIEGINVGFDKNILMTEDLSKFGSQRKTILERFETLMGEKAKND